MHKVREQYNGPGNTPYAQRLDLGWVIVGEVCMGGVHKSETANVFRTNILQNGHTSFFLSCSKLIQVKEQFGTPIHQYQSTLVLTRPNTLWSLCKTCSSTNMQS